MTSTFSMELQLGGNSSPNNLLGSMCLSLTLLDGDWISRADLRPSVWLVYSQTRDVLTQKESRQSKFEMS